MLPENKYKAGNIAKAKVTEVKATRVMARTAVRCIYASNCGQARTGNEHHAKPVKTASRYCVGAPAYTRHRFERSG
jgi:hypothetical protein